MGTGRVVGMLVWDMWMQLLGSMRWGQWRQRFCGIWVAWPVQQQGQRPVACSSDGCSGGNMQQRCADGDMLLRVCSGGSCCVMMCTRGEQCGGGPGRHMGGAGITTRPCGERDAIMMWVAGV
jgi:hypothetical protein